MSTSNIHIMQREHERKQRRVLREMAARSAEHAKLSRHRDQVAGQVNAAAAELQRIVAELELANQRGDRRRQAELAAEAEQLAARVAELRADEAATGEEMDRLKAAYADWQSRMPAKWDPVPIRCLQCGGDRVVSMHGRSGICDDCDADVAIDARPIIRNGRVLRQRPKS